MPRISRQRKYLFAKPVRFFDALTRSCVSEPRRHSGFVEEREANGEAAAALRCALDETKSPFKTRLVAWMLIAKGA